ncbi:hypothetical protein EUGRSUZ_I00943 [Eucalyptus grandis]|uniref:Uncharacterized protein n=2 Tax=Eucalyptus grandis TaxID=71139 RepID=A0ACC3JG90_EUCGR|nr:hypothetical protein EUGRSUZ_I00943 [Eucalyptus grandis]
MALVVNAIRSSTQTWNWNETRRQLGVHIKKKRCPFGEGDQTYQRLHLSGMGLLKTGLALNKIANEKQKIRRIVNFGNAKMRLEQPRLRLLLVLLPPSPCAAALAVEEVRDGAHRDELGGSSGRIEEGTLSWQPVRGWQSAHLHRTWCTRRRPSRKPWPLELQGWGYGYEKKQ